MEDFMNVDKFFECAVHLDNFTREQLIELLDFDEIEDLPDASIRQIAVEALGSFLMGNRDYPKSLYKRFDNLDRRLFLDTWFSVIKEPETLKRMGRFVANYLIHMASMEYQPLSPDIYAFIKDNFNHIYYSDDGIEHSYTNPEPYITHDPAEAGKVGMCIYLKVLSPEAIGCVVETWYGPNPDRSELLENPEPFLELIMKWHPNIDIYSCEQVSKQHDSLQKELVNNSRTEQKKVKI